MCQNKDFLDLSALLMNKREDNATQGVSNVAKITNFENQTLYYDSSYPHFYTQETLKQAVACLKNDELIAFPTETVFGLGAIATSERAVSRVFKAKGRPSDNPLIVHVSAIDQVYDYAEHVSDLASALMTTFWPGALTIIFPVKKGVLPLNVTAGKDTVALRMPNQADALRLIEAVGVPLVGPSANVSGRPSPTEVSHVFHDFKGKIAGVLEPTHSASDIGVESTVVYPMADGIRLLRPGAITKEDLAKFGVPVIEVSAKEQLKNPAILSPGVKYTHYSPNQPVYLVDSAAAIKNWEKWIANSPKRVGILAMEAVCQSFPDAIRFSLGDSVQTATQRLYAGLRYLESQPIDIIFAQGLPPSDESGAYMNRLEKAASSVLIVE